MRALQGKFVLHKTTYIVPNLIIFVYCKEYNIDNTLRFMLFELTIFKEYTFAAVGGYVPISHNPRKFQYRAILACLNFIVDKSLRYITFENSSYFRENNKYFLFIIM